MTPPHLEVLAEEPSMEAFLKVLLPRMSPGATFKIHPFQGKRDLLKKLERRLRAYKKKLQPNHRIAIVIDRDNDDCRELKDRLESLSIRSGLVTRTRSRRGRWQVVNRIVVEELEAWYFGDWTAVCEAYPRTPPNIPSRAAYRRPDAIRGGTWEKFERIMQRHGYFKGGLRKVEAARAIAEFIEPARNSSDSFQKFRDAIVEATGSNSVAAELATGARRGPRR